MRALLAATVLSTSLLASGLARAERSDNPSKRDEPAERDRAEAGDARRIDIGVLGGIGFPRPLAIEPIVGFGRTVMLGGEYSFLPTTTIASVNVRMWGAAADIRLFPFRGAFFIGLRGGFQQISGDGTLTATGVGSYTESVTVGSWFVNPRVGFLWVWKPFAFGFDAGAQVPISTSVSRSSLLAVAAPEIDARISSATNMLGRSVLPTTDLLRVGLVF
jgi:hypothetical protein